MLHRSRRAQYGQFPGAAATVNWLSPQARGLVYLGGFSHGLHVPDLLGISVPTTPAGNPTLIAGPHGGLALDLDGDTDRIDVANNPHITDIWDGGGTLVSWYVARSAGTGSFKFGRLASKGDGAASSRDGWDINIKVASNSLVFAHEWSFTHGQWEVANAWTAGAVTHLCVRYDSDSNANDPEIWLNGQAASVSETSAPAGGGGRSSDAAYDLMIGDRNNLDREWDGYIWHMALYDYYWPDALVAASYDARSRWDLYEPTLGLRVKAPAAAPAGARPQGPLGHPLVGALGGPI